MLTQARLKSELLYDAETGIFRWRKRHGKMLAGSVAGTLRSDGRRKIGIDGERHLSSRLAWLYVYGELPARDVDHRDRNKGNDRIENLRKATRSLNNANGKAWGASAFRGVGRHQRGWRARIKYRGKQTWLGYFTSEKEAALAYDAAARRIFGEFAKPNFAEGMSYGP